MEEEKKEQATLNELPAVQNNSSPPKDSKEINKELLQTPVVHEPTFLVLNNILIDYCTLKILQFIWHFSNYTTLR